jgi:hypothetical protein
VEAHLNFSYAIIGQPPGAQVDNVFSFAVAARWYVSERLDLFAEVLGNTAASPEAEGGGEVGPNAELTARSWSARSAPASGWRLGPCFRWD